MSFQGDFHNFKAFVAEEEDMNTFLKLRTKEKEEPVDKKIQKKVDKERENREKVCPRCGHKEGEGCKCGDDDFYSTVNAYRIPRGQQVYVKEMKNLKSFDNYLQESSDSGEFSHTYNLGHSWWTRWEKKNRNKYDFSHVKDESYWAVYSKDDVHLFTYDYEKGEVYSDEPKTFFET
jgi:hypothetical protein